MRADLHIHTCLSPCASLDMSPRHIARFAARAGLDLVAVTDHNSALNCPAMERACRDQGVAFIPGIELTTAEELHLLCYFPDTAAALAFGELLGLSLAPVRMIPDRMGDQVVVNERDEIQRMVEHFLGVASSWGVDEAVARVHVAGGLAVPAHVDRPSMSVLSQLGRMPDLPFDALEATPGAIARIRAEYGARFAVLSSSDAHHTDQMGRGCFEFPGTAPGFDALRRALREAPGKVLALNLRA